MTNLERHHEMKKRGVIPCSLYLDHILSNSDMFVSSQRVVADKSKDMAVVSRVSLATPSLVSRLVISLGRDTGIYRQYGGRQGATHYISVYVKREGALPLYLDKGFTSGIKDKPHPLWYH